jgi:hypothetical protein
VDEIARSIYFAVRWSPVHGVQQRAPNRRAFSICSDLHQVFRSGHAEADQYWKIGVLPDALDESGGRV